MFVNVMAPFYSGRMIMSILFTVILCNCGGMVQRTVRRIRVKKFTADQISFHYYEDQSSLFQNYFHFFENNFEKDFLVNQLLTSFLKIF